MMQFGDLKMIVGIDEVGRGCLAGPVVAAAVVLGEPIAGLKDSKLLSPKKRQELDRLIKESALSIAIGSVDAASINKLGLTESIRLAMQQALSQVQVAYNHIIIDGNYNFLQNNPKTVTIIRADDLYPSVSAASIVAKVYRDNLMKGLSSKYPQYGFEKHVGYGTKLHLDRLAEFGPSPIHRMFYKPLLKYN